MLTKMILRNWQNHKKKIIKLSQVTTLVGSNGAGKSAIWRALKFICLNKWDGESNDHVTWERSQSSLTLFVDGIRVVRQKGKSVNDYFLMEDKFKSFGTSVPKPISDHLQIDEKNFQGQDDLAYWLYLTGGEAAKCLNGIVNLEIIDEVTSNIATITREAKAKLVGTKERLEETQNLKKSLSFLTEADEHLSKIESLEKDLAQQSHRIGQILAFESQARSIQERIQTSSLRLSGLNSAIPIYAKLDDLAELKDQRVKLDKVKAMTEFSADSVNKLKKKKALLVQSLSSCPLCGRTD